MSLSEKTINGKTSDAMTFADWEAVDLRDQAQRLREQLQREIARCRERLDSIERDLNHPHGQFWHTAGAIGNAATDLETVAAQYAFAQRTATSLIRSLGTDHRMAHRGPGEEVVALFKWLRECIGLPALPPILVFSHREAKKAKLLWSVALGDRTNVIATFSPRAQAEERAISEAKSRGGLEVKVEEG